MKRGMLILATALALGVCMSFCSWFMVKAPPAHHEDAEFATESGNLLPELDWLKQSLHLTDAQHEKVKALHVAYRPKCDQLCKRIRAADTAVLAAAKQKAEAGPELTAALRARADVLVECQQAMLSHIQQTATCMDAKQADQYRDFILPYALGISSSCCGKHQD